MSGYESKPGTLRIIALATFIAGMVLLLASQAANASKGDMRGALAFAVAKVAANEGALINLNEVKLVWQVVEGHADDTAGQYRFLRSHSGRVLGSKNCLHGNCIWTRNLKLNPFYQPHESDVDPGYWRVITAPRWRETMRLARSLVMGKVPDGWEPCPITPVTWGSRDPDLPDLEHARSIGLAPIGCKGTLNDGFAAIAKVEALATN